MKRITDTKILLLLFLFVFNLPIFVRSSDLSESSVAARLLPDVKKKVFVLSIKNLTQQVFSISPNVRIYSFPADPYTQPHQEDPLVDPLDLKDIVYPIIVFIGPESDVNSPGSGAVQDPVNIEPLRETCITLKIPFNSDFRGILTKCTQVRFALSINNKIFFSENFNPAIISTLKEKQSKAPH